MKLKSILALLLALGLLLAGCKSKSEPAASEKRMPHSLHSQ